MVFVILMGEEKKQDFEIIITPGDVSQGLGQPKVDDDLKETFYDLSPSTDFARVLIWRKKIFWMF